MQCQCGSQAGEYKSGISKKNGKPWSGWKCSQCGNMQFTKSYPAPQTNAVPQQPNQNTQKLDEILRLVKDIHISMGLSPMDKLPAELRTPDEEGF